VFEDYVTRLSASHKTTWTDF